MQNWIAISGISNGPLLRSVDRWGCVDREETNPASISYVGKSLVKAAGFNPRLYAVRSLRSGFVTATSAGVASDRQTMRRTGHKS